MRKYVIILFCLISSFVFSQEIGYYFDVRGNEIDQFIQIENSTFVNKSISANLMYMHAPGIIHYKSGEIKKGELQIVDGNKLSFENQEEQSKKLDLSLIKSFKIALDTFVVVNQTKLKKTKNNDKYTILGFIDETKRYKLYLQKNSGKKLFFLKDKLTGEWIDTKRNEKRDFHIEIVSKFSHVKPIIQTLTNYNSNDITQIVKSTKYYEYFLKDEVIYLKSDFSETKNSSTAAQSYAKINSVTDSIWNISFFTMDNQLTINANYSALFPFIKEGKFTSYFPNGQIRKEGMFKAGEPDGVFKKYHNNGNLQATFKYIGKKKEIEYVNLFDNKGSKIIGKSRISQTIYDSINNRKIQFLYEKNRLFSAGYLDSSLNKLIYLLPEYPISYKSNSLFDYPKYALKKGITGPVIVKIILDNNGEILQKTVLNSPNNILKNVVLKHLEDESNLKFKPGRFNKNKVLTDFLFFFNFKIESTYIQTNYYHNLYWDHFLWLESQIHEFKPPPHRF